MKDKYIWIIGGVLLIAALVFVPRSCEKTTESTTAMLTAANITITEMRGGMRELKDLVTEKTDSLWTLRAQLITVKGQSVLITEVSTELSPDKWLNPERPEYIAMTDTSITRRFTLDDSSYSWIDDIALAVIVRDGSVDFRIEFASTEIHFNTKDLETTLGLSVWYYVGGVIAVLVAYIAGTITP